MLPLVSTALRRFMTAAAAWRREQQDRRQLMAMSEAELRDIGIGRSQIPGLLETAPSQGIHRQATARSETWVQALERRTA